MWTVKIDLPWPLILAPKQAPVQTVQVFAVLPVSRSQCVDSLAAASCRVYHARNEDTNSLFLADCYCCWLGLPGFPRRSANCQEGGVGKHRWGNLMLMNHILEPKCTSVNMCAFVCECWYNCCIPPVSYYGGGEGLHFNISHSLLQLSTRSSPTSFLTLRGVLSIAACFALTLTVTHRHTRSITLYLSLDLSYMHLFTKHAPSASWTWVLQAQFPLHQLY